MPPQNQKRLFHEPGLVHATPSTDVSTATRQVDSVVLFTADQVSTHWLIVVFTGSGWPISARGYAKFAWKATPRNHYPTFASHSTAV